MKFVQIYLVKLKCKRNNDFYENFNFFKVTSSLCHYVQSVLISSYQLVFSKYGSVKPRKLSHHFQTKPQINSLC